MKSHPADLGHVLAHYFPDASWQVLNMQGSGVNNTTTFIEANDERYVLRVYETHRDEDKVSFEHEVLLKLSETELPIHTPIPILSRNGLSYVRTNEGKLAALFRYIGGKPPEL